MAAFVGAIGVFRLQMFRDHHRNAERRLRERAAPFTSRDTRAIPLYEVLEAVENPKDPHPENPNWVEALEWARLTKGDWEALVWHLRAGRNALIRLEAWTLCMLGISIIGFNFIPWLKYARWLPWVVAALVIVTVLVTLWSVIVWTRGVEE